jgi:hypothetical protein
MYTTTTFALTLAAACGLYSGAITEPPEGPPDREPPGLTPRENVYFCCHDVDHETKSGDGCITIGEKQVDSCASVLCCADGFTKKDGVVTCM